MTGMLQCFGENEAKIAYFGLFETCLIFWLNKTLVLFTSLVRLQLVTALGVLPSDWDETDAAADAIQDIDACTVTIKEIREYSWWLIHLKG